MVRYILIFLLTIAISNPTKADNQFRGNYTANFTTKTGQKLADAGCGEVPIMVNIVIDEANNLIGHVSNLSGKTDICGIMHNGTILGKIDESGQLKEVSIKQKVKRAPDGIKNRSAIKIVGQVNGELKLISSNSSMFRRVEFTLERQAEEQQIAAPKFGKQSASKSDPINESLETETSEQKVAELQQQIDQLKKIQKLEQELAALKNDTSSAAQNTSTDASDNQPVAAEESELASQIEKENEPQTSDLAKAAKGLASGAATALTNDNESAGSALALAGAAAVLSGNAEAVGAANALGALSSSLGGNLLGKASKKPQPAAPNTPPTENKSSKAEQNTSSVTVAWQESSYPSLKGEINTEFQQHKVGGQYIDYHGAELKEVLHNFYNNYNIYHAVMEKKLYPNAYGPISTRAEKKWWENANKETENYPYGGIKAQGSAGHVLYRLVLGGKYTNSTEFITCSIRKVPKQYNIPTGHPRNLCLFHTSHPIPSNHQDPAVLRVEFDKQGLNYEEFYDGDIIGFDAKIINIEFVTDDGEDGYWHLLNVALSSTPIMVREEYVGFERKNTKITKSGGPYGDGDGADLAKEQKAAAEIERLEEVSDFLYAVKSCYEAREGYVLVYINADENRVASAKFKRFLSTLDLPKEEIDKVLEVKKAAYKKVAALYSGDWNEYNSENCKAALKWINLSLE